jgi:RibD C-terminal domain
MRSIETYGSQKSAIFSKQCPEYVGSSVVSMMRRLAVFSQVTLDGSFAGMNGDIRWAHKGNQDGLIDEYQIVVNPAVLGKGRTVFEGIKEKLTPKMKKTRTFGNGNLLLCDEPAG